MEISNTLTKQCYDCSFHYVYQFKISSLTGLVLITENVTITEVHVQEYVKRVFRLHFNYDSSRYYFIYLLIFV